MATLYTSCNESGLGIYTPDASKPWNDQRINHFYRRFGFGATPAIVKAAKNQTPSNLIDALLNEAENMPVSADPGWGYLDKDEGVAYSGVDSYWHLLRGRFLHLMFDNLRENHIRARMTMFMHELFVCSTKNIVQYMFQSYLTKQKYALGNFKDFIHDMGLDACMLKYLNNFENKAGNPNENYARELYELFTLGVDNGYTEQDIQETARAMTGYNSLESSDGVISFTLSTFDDGEKTIFGQTGNWGYSDVIDILFEQKSDLIATYICTKLYKYFVSDTVNDTIITSLATIFIQNNFELKPVLSTLFKSEHFFDEACIGVLFKTPLDLVMLHDKEVGYQVQDIEDIPNMFRLFPFSALYVLEMDLLSPPNVSGWIKHKAWINSVSVAERISEMQNFARKNYGLNKDSQVYENFIATLFDADTDAETVARGIVDFFLSKPLIYESEYQEAIAVFKEDVPENYFQDGTWDIYYTDIAGQVKNLLDYIFTIPEFQLK